VEQSPSQRREFLPGEQRPLAVEKLEPSGQVPQAVAEFVSADAWPTHQARHFQLRIADCGFGGLSIQLNGGDPADDEQRLAAIVRQRFIDEAHAAEIAAAMEAHNASR